MRLLRITSLALTLGLAPLAAAAEEAPAYEVYALKYAMLKDYPTDAVLFGTDRGKVMDVPFAYAYIKGPGVSMVFDTGHTENEPAEELDITVLDYVDHKTLLGRLGVDPAGVTTAIIGHMHWDHGGGLDAFPAAQFVIQRREIEFVAGIITQFEHTMAGFYAPDVLKLVKAHWEGRVRIVDGDEEIAPGIKVHLAPGHTAGTQFATVNTRAGQALLAGDVVYSYRNLREDIPLGFGYDLVEMLHSFEKVRDAMGDTDRLFVPGHDMEVFTKFPEVAERIVQIK
jgi:glyoxylase-like metal-dependent hydrolase (beta-lactamase superfamily II)